MNNGGMIYFSCEINAVRLHKNGLINRAMQLVRGFRNRMRILSIIAKIIQENGSQGFSIEKNIIGCYIADNGTKHIERSMRLTIIMVTTEQLNAIASELAKALYQESVLVVNNNNNTTDFIS
jgi:hypothetical protein